MTDNELIKKLESLVGQSIVDISYIQTKFHYPHPEGFAQGDWTTINPNLFMLHSPEWQLKLSGGQTLFVAAELLTEENFAAKFILANSTKTKPDENVLTIPKAFNWRDILNKPIKSFRLWKRIINSSKFLGYEFNLKYQDFFQIIDLVCGDTIFSLTIMNGDIGHMTFYPTGVLGDSVGVFFNKAVCTSHTVYDLTMRMAMIYKSRLAD